MKRICQFSLMLLLVMGLYISIGNVTEVYAVCAKHGQSTTLSPKASSYCVDSTFTQTVTCNSCKGVMARNTVRGTRQHNYGSYSPATSTKCSGVSFTQTRSCSYCGHKNSRTATGTKSHSYGSYSPATSTKCSGVSFTQTRSCSSCGRNESRTATGTRAHKQSSFSPATSERCTGVSFTQTATCTYNCGNKSTRTATGTRAHSYLSTPCFTHTATYCDDTSYNQYACKYGCGNKQTSYGNKGTSHYTNINGKTAVSPTCITQGVIQYYCKCGVKTNQKKTGFDSTKHEGSETKTVTLKPTCTSKGSATIICNGCNKSKGTTPVDIDKNNHSNTRHHYIDIAPTCINNGKRQYYCACGKATDVEELTDKKATGKHSKDVAIAGSPSTCTSTGWEVFLCNGCQRTYHYTIPMKAHIESFTVRYTSTTCKKTGYWTKYCTSGHEYTVTNTQDTGINNPNYHSYGAETIITEAYCTTAGKKTKTCKDCGHVNQSSYYDASNHKPSSLSWKHDNTGWGQHCSDCGVKVGNFGLSESNITDIIGSRFTKQYQRVDSSGTNHGGICNMCALTNILNRKLVVDGLFNEQNNYFNILSVIKTTSGADARYSDTASNHIISDGETGAYYNKSYSLGSKTYTLKRASADTVSMIQELLKTHPEGVFVRFGTANHCVVITDYKDGHYYVMDSVNTYSGIYDNGTYSYVYKKIGAFEDSDIDTVGYLE